MRRVTSISLALAVFGAAATQALGRDNCVFDVASGDWSVPGNWDECSGVIPTSEDTATILNGQTCKVETSDQAVGALTVNTGGTLGVIGKTLDLHDDGTIDGTVYVKSDGVVQIRGDVSLDGEGIITARGPNYGPGDLQNFLSALVLTIGEDLTVAGDMTISATLVNNGTFLVDGSDDVMILKGGGLVGLGGSGSFVVSDGEMRPQFHAFVVGGTHVWYVSGEGLLTIGVDCYGCSVFRGSFEITGGELAVNRNLCTEGDLTFSGGTIDVLNNRIAVFDASCQ